MTAIRCARRALFALAVVAVTATGAALPPAAHSTDQSAAAAAPAVTPGQLANDVRFRQTFGLRADEAYVRALYDQAARGSVDASSAGGALLTKAEEDELIARQQRSNVVIDAADRYFATQPPDVYAGLYIDNARSSTVVIGVTDDVATHTARLRAAIGDVNVPWEVVRQAASLDTLYALQRAVDAAIDGLVAQGVDVSSTAVDEEANAVVVGVASDRTQATQVLRSQFPGERILVDDMPHPRFAGVDHTDAPPLRGGQRIQAVHGNMIGLCTSAFVGYLVERLELGLLRTTHRLISAGHCEVDEAGNALVASAPWTQVNYPIGLSDKNVFVSGSTADALSIMMSSTDKSPEIAITGLLRNLVRCEEALDDDRKGQQVAASGATSGGSRGGTLTQKRMTVIAELESGAKVRLVNQREANFGVLLGDSGGSVFGSRRCAWQAQGIVSAGGKRNGKPIMTYSHIGYAIRKLGLSGVVTATAG